MADGTFQKLKTSIAANCKAKKDKDECTGRSDKAEGSKPHSAGSLRYHHSDCNHDRYHCNDLNDRYKTIIATMMIVETAVTTSIVMEGSIVSTRIMAVTITIVLMARKQMTSR
jgi:hypothetical protein